MSHTFLNGEDAIVPSSPDSLFSISSSSIDSSVDRHNDHDDPHTSALRGPEMSCCPTPARDDHLGDPVAASKPAHYFDTNTSILRFQPVPGLYYLPNLIDESLEQQWMMEIADLNLLCDGRSNQMMYFSCPSSSPGALPIGSERADRGHSFLNWPSFLVDLIYRLPSLITGSANPDNMDGVNDLMFGPAKAALPWQVIVNLYRPGQGIEQHVDLVDRFDELVLGISLGSSVAMQFEPLSDGNLTGVERLYLKQRSGYLIAREARYGWTHGIAANQFYDWVHDASRNETRRVQRVRTRVSITIRRLKPDADLLK